MAAVGVEQFVEEHKVGLGQHAFGVRDEIAFAQAADVKGAEELVGLGEAGEQVFEGMSFDQLPQSVHHGAFGCAGRSEQEQVFASHEANAHEVDDVVFADKCAFQVPQDRIELVDQVHFRIG